MRRNPPSPFYKALGSRIRELRGSSLTQEQLGKAANLSRTSVVNIEAGRQNLLVHNLFGIAKALNVQPTKLLQPLEEAGAFQLADLVVGDDEATAWVRRSLAKAILQHSPNDSPKTDL